MGRLAIVRGVGEPSTYTKTTIIGPKTLQLEFCRCCSLQHGSARGTHRSTLPSAANVHDAFPNPRSIRHQHRHWTYSPNRRPCHTRSPDSRTDMEGIAPALQNIIPTTNLDRRLDLKIITLHAGNV